MKESYYKVRNQLGIVKKRITEAYEDFSYPKTKSYAQVSSFKNKHEGKRCFVVGNGPSINRQDLNLMKDDYVFVSNSFFLKFKDLEFRPQFYTVEDHLVAEDNHKEINELSDIIKFLPYDLRHVLKESENGFYINLKRAYTDRESDKFPFFNVDKDVFYWGGTVLHMSLQLAAYMGFKEIYLIGVDLTYKIPKDTIQRGTVLTSTSDDPNHFDPTYFGKGKRWHLPEVDRMQKAFSKAYYTLKEHDIKLFNATDKGNLKTIPRSNYEQLFG